MAVMGTRVMKENTMENQVTIYGHGGDATEEFPVLRAFQQYINEEQNKARKRMVGLCIFFTVLMILIVGVFMLMMFQLSSRNQQLNDRLVDFAMRERTPPAASQPVIVQPPAPAVQTDSAAIKAMTDSIAALQKQLADQQAAQQAAQQASVQAAPAVPSEAETRLVDEETERLRRIKERMERERARLEAERKKIADERKQIADEKERRRQEEIEQYRRRQYPEYYAKLDAEAAAQAAASAAPASAPQTVAPSPAPAAPAAADKPRQLTQADLDDLLREVDEILASDEEEDEPMPAISYFDEADEEPAAAPQPTESKPKVRIPLD